MIGGEVVVTVLAISGEQVRFGIQAPRDVAVYRGEIYKRIRAHAPRKESLPRMPTPQVYVRRRRSIGSIGSIGE